MTYSRLILKRIEELMKKSTSIKNINSLARQCGLKQSSIFNLKCGSSTNPQIATIHKIANAFGMTVAEFLDFPEMNDFECE